MIDKEKETKPTKKPEAHSPFGPDYDYLVSFTCDYGCAPIFHTTSSKAAREHIEWHKIQYKLERELDNHVEKLGIEKVVHRVNSGEKADELAANVLRYSPADCECDSCDLARQYQAMQENK